MSDQELLAAVETNGRALCEAVHTALEGGVSQALLLPTLLGVFREAGMIPEGLDLDMIMGMLR